MVVGSPIRHGLPAWMSTASKVNFDVKIPSAMADPSSSSSPSSDRSSTSSNSSMGFAKRARSAAGAMVLSAILVNPLDVAKTRLQAQVAGVLYSHSLYQFGADMMSLVYRSGETFSLVDKHMGSYPSECIESFASLAIRCCQEETDARPAMPEVVRELEKIWNMMPEMDTAFSVSMETESSTTTKPSSSSSSSSAAMKPYTSFEISGSDVSSGMPPVTPR